MSNTKQIDPHHSLVYPVGEADQRRRIAFVDHSYHLKTLSTVFLRTALFPNHQVDEFWDESWNGGDAVDIETLVAKDYDLVVVVQVEVAAEALARLGYTRVVFIPMWDSCRQLPESWWRALDGFRIVSFCETLHERVREYGLPSINLQYYPDPSGFAVVSDFAQLRGFFWQRHQDITWRTVARLIGDTPDFTLHVHLAQDPSAEPAETPSAQEHVLHRITTSHWFERKEQYKDLVARSNVYFAPRATEGIGFSLLEAMAMGMCVVAADAPTMNEYLTDDVSGLLWNPADPQPLDFSRAAELGRRARDKVVVGHQKWLSELPRLREFVGATDNRLAVFTDSLRFRGGRNDTIAERARARNVHLHASPVPEDQSFGGLRSRGLVKTDDADRPLVTIVTATLNCIDQFEGTIRNILSQDYPHLEVIVLDGGSTDGTLDLIARYDEQLDFWSSEKDDGTYFAMNKAAHLAHGRYILFMNAGDWFFGDDAVSRAMRGAPSDADFIIGHHLYRQLDGDERFHKANSFEKTWKLLTESVTLTDAWRQGVPCHQATFTRTTLLRAQRYDTTFRIAADHEFMYRQRSRGASFHNCDELIAVYTGGGLSQKAYLRTLDEWIQITSRYASPAAVDALFGADRRAAMQGSNTMMGQLIAAGVREERYLKDLEHLRNESHKLQVEAERQRVLAERFIAEAAHFRREAEEQRADAEGFKTAVREYQTSTSWRITAPLRRAIRLFS